MTTTLAFGPPSGRCRVLTFKEGLLSAVAHDLRFVCGRWQATVDLAARTLSARFETASLAVETVMRQGQPAAGVLGPREFDRIAATMRDEVLRTRTFPEAVFVAPLPEAAAGVLGGAGEVATGGYALAGQLTLCGVTRPLTVEVRREGASWVASGRIVQPDFGIRPYSAMLGALRIRPEVAFELTVPA
jgi:hypothetical protein